MNECHSLWEEQFFLDKKAFVIKTYWLGIKRFPSSSNHRMFILEIIKFFPN